MSEVFLYAEWDFVPRCNTYVLTDMREAKSDYPEGGVRKLSHGTVRITGVPR